MIRKRKRNPDDDYETRQSRRLSGWSALKEKLKNTLTYGNPIDFVNAISAYKIGLECHDCDNSLLKERPKSYYDCECEKCRDCKFNRCLCDLNIKFKGFETKDYSKSEREQVKKAGHEFLFQILEDDFYNDGIKYNIIPDTEKKLKKEFLTAVLKKENIDLSYILLIDHNLCDLNLHKVNLSGAVIYRGNFENSDLSDSNFSNAKLYASRFINTNLKRANLTGTDLSLVDFSGSDLTGANLSESKFSQTDFTDTIITNSTKLLDIVNFEHAVNLTISNPRKKRTMSETS